MTDDFKVFSDNESWFKTFDTIYKMPLSDYIETMKEEFPVIFVVVYSRNTRDRLDDLIERFHGRLTTRFVGIVWETKFSGNVSVIGFKDEDAVMARLSL